MNESIERVLAVLDGFRMSGEMTYSAYSVLYDEISLLDDLLKEQEPRVMLLEEAPKADVCWLEWRKRGRKPVACRVFIRWNNVGDKVAWGYRFFEEPTIYSIRKYGKDWRCWTSRPTDEQRKATPWEPPKEG